MQQTAETRSNLVRIVRGDERVRPPSVSSTSRPAPTDVRRVVARRWADAAGHGYRGARQAVDLWRERLGARKPACHPGRRRSNPPRKLSGTRTAGVRHLWRAGSAASRRCGSHRRGKSSERVRPQPRESLRFRDRGGGRPPRAAEPTRSRNLRCDDGHERVGRRAVRARLRRAARSPTATSVPSDAEQAAMLAELGYASLDALVDAAVPAAIREHAPLALGARRVGAGGARPAARRSARATRCSRR